MKSPAYGGFFINTIARLKYKNRCQFCFTNEIKMHKKRYNGFAFRQFCYSPTHTGKAGSINGRTKIKDPVIPFCPDICSASKEAPKKPLSLVCPKPRSGTKKTIAIKIFITVPRSSEGNKK